MNLLSKFKWIIGYSALLGAVLFALPLSATAQASWPTKPVHIIVPFISGTSSDIIARMLSAPLSEALGQPVLVENKVGAAGIIGAQAAARSPADGYTLFLSVHSIMAINPHIYKKLPYDPLKDFVAVTQVVRVPFVLVTAPTQRFNSLNDVLVEAKAKPGSVDFGSIGVGSGPHVAMAMLNNMADIQMTHVPYKGTPLSDVLGGQIPLSFQPSTMVMPLIKAGQLRALGVTSEKRVQSLPSVPAISEVLPGYDADGWQGFYVPTGTPPAVVTQLNAVLVKILNSPDIDARLRGYALEPAAGTPEQLDRVTRTDFARWGKVVEDSNIQAE